MKAEWPILKKMVRRTKSIILGFLTKYYSSLDNPSRANCDFGKQIFARDCKNS